MVEAELKTNAVWQKELARLRASLRPLRHTTFDHDPPEDLAERTCLRVAELADATPVRPASRVVVSPPSRAPTEPGPATFQSWSWRDLIAAACICTAAVLLIFPALQNSRDQARVVTCQSHLGQLGLALTQYSERHGGYFPVVPSHGNFASAGIYAPTLKQAGLLQDSSWIVCPSSPLAEDRQFDVPYLRDLGEVRGQVRLDQLRRRMGGSYGYCLGYVENGVYHVTINLRRPSFAIMADTPGETGPWFDSSNHGGKGQNVLFEDGHVVFFVTSRPADISDHFYLNDTGLMAAGAHQNDAVVGSSDTAPVRLVNMP